MPNIKDAIHCVQEPIRSLVLQSLFQRSSFDRLNILDSFEQADDCIIYRLSYVEAADISGHLRAYQNVIAKVQHHNGQLQLKNIYGIKVNISRGVNLPTQAQTIPRAYVRYRRP